MYLHYDHETDGLNVSGQPSDHPDQPGVVSLSAVLDDEDGKTILEYSTLVQPIRQIDPVAVAIHGITYERAMDEGIPHQHAVEHFAEMAAQAQILSAFNHFFDFKMLKIGCARFADPAAGDRIRQMLETKSAICTMDSARKFLKAGRFIKLTVAHQQLLGRDFDKAHESMADTQAHRRIFYHLRHLGALVEPKSMARKEYSTPPPPRDRKPDAPEPSRMASDDEITLALGKRSGKPAAILD